MTKKIVLIIIVIGLIFAAGYWFLREKEPSFILFEVIKEDIVEELWENGKVQRGERINLSFQSAGQIEKIYVQASQEVEKGEILAKLDDTDVNFQLQTARNSLELAQLNLEKLLAGSGPEEIKIAQKQAESAGIFLESAEENLKNSYQTAITALNVSYPQIYNAFDFAEYFVGEYVVIYDEEGRELMRLRDEIKNAEEEVKIYWEIARNSGADYQDIETAILKMINSLEMTFNSLEKIRETVDKSAVYKNKISAADKNSLDTLKASVNSSLVSVIGFQQTISSVKLSFEAAKTKLQEAENYLALIVTGARQVDIDLYEMQIKQAQTQVRFYENQIEKLILRSPIKAQVVAINKREGETVQSMIGDVVVSLMPKVPFEIRANIYEEDIVKIKKEAPVKISFPAFPKEFFKGSVIFIDEAEKIIDGVVYYEIRIAFDREPPEGIRTTMTADIIIQIARKENVFVVPREAVKRDGNKEIVEVLKDNLIKEKEVEVGLRSDEKLEIITGLTEGEKVIVR